MTEDLRSSTALLLVNLGSPNSPGEQDVRIYLRQFLMDGKVLDTPWIIRKMIVEGFILPSRPQKSAEAYKSVWMPEGAPLKVLTSKFRTALAPLVNMPVAVVMRYQHPEPLEALSDIEAAMPGVQQILIAPLYPHYAMSSYETALEYVRDRIAAARPALTFKVLQPFYDETAYVAALQASIKPYLNDYDHLLFSFHGLPVRHLRKSDPTHRHCYSSDKCCDIASPAWDFCYKHQVITTTRLVAGGLQIPSHKFSYSFQSRLGRDEWIKPFTVEQLEKFPLRGIKKLLVVCPAFVVDCLETLEEMGMQGKETFLNAGGTSFTLIPCLNDSPEWIQAFAGYCNVEKPEYEKLWV